MIIGTYTVLFLSYTNDSKKMNIFHNAFNRISSEPQEKYWDYKKLLLALLATKYFL